MYNNNRGIVMDFETQNLIFLKFRRRAAAPLIPLLYKCSPGCTLITIGNQSQIVLFEYGTALFAYVKYYG